MDDEILQEFVVESTEALDRLDVELVDLEQDPTDVPTLSSIFRRVHTIKGTCGFLGFDNLERVTHTGESLLSRLRDGQITATPEVVSALLELVDAVREMMDVIVATGEDGGASHDDLVARLTRLANGEALVAPAAGDDDRPAATEDADGAEVTDDPPGGAAATGTEDPPAPEGTPPVEGRIGDILIAAGKVSRADVERALACQDAGDPRHVGEILVGWGLVTPEETLQGLQRQRQRLSSTGAVAESSIRVDVELLDTLVNLVGELVLNRNQILQHTRGSGDPALAATLQHLDLITTELQGGVMQTRMQPIETAWAKFPRVVRDLARQRGKDVRLEMHGHETELDKTLLEAIKDPLTHIVRNAVDHGIEPPDVRESRGKGRHGTLTLRAFHESGQVVIEVADDGGGIDPHRVRDLAVARGVISESRAGRLSLREMTDLVFAPGFSTAATVDSISGRGVGMDVVRTNIVEIGGTVDLTSQPGVGTTLRVRIPLTLAIIPALMVSCDGSEYAIPQVSLVELVRVGGDHPIESVQGVPVFRLRGHLLPLVHLNQLLSEDPVEPSGDHVVVVRSGERIFGLVVDGVDDTAEIVVKPLGRLLRDVGAFAGATIMGDGTVALILDVGGLSVRAGLASEMIDEHRSVDVSDDAAGGDARTLLLFRLGSDRTYAMELSQVARLEEFDASAIERSGSQEVVQYRGRILPLCRVADLLDPGPRPERSERSEHEPVRVIVYRDGDADVGFVVDEIADVVHRRITVTRDVDAPGLSGSAVIDGVVADLVDVADLLSRLGLVAHS